MRSPSDPKGFKSGLEEAHRRLHDRCLKIHIPRMVGLHRRRMGARFHSTPEFFLQTGGATDFDCAGGKFRLRKNEVCIMPAGVAHAETPIDLRTPYGVLVAMQDSDACMLLRGSANASRQIESYGMMRFAGLGYAFQFLDHAARHLSIHPMLRNNFVEGLIDSFLAAILTGILQPGAGHTHEHSLLVSEAMKLVRVELSKPDTSVSSIARKLGCSPDYLSRRFNAEHGMTLNVWIARERTQLARELLAWPGYSIKEIGGACGFTSASYFIRVFRAHTGFTPAGWREQKSSIEENPPISQSKARSWPRPRVV